MHPHMLMPTGRLMQILHHCATICFMTSDKLLSRSDAHARRSQIKLLSDCAAICEVCAKFISSNSLLMKSICEYCAYVCEVCGHECLMHPDQESQMCGRICLNCAKECRSYAMQHGS